MIVEIWSDFECPFCYIGKRRFEKGLELFPYKEKVTVEFRSFQLDPSEKNPAHDIHDVVAIKTGMSREEARAMNQQLAEQAEAVGLNLRFDEIIPANTLNAHRLVMFAEQYDKKAEAVERLFKAYFSESKDIDDLETLAELGREIGLDYEKVMEMLKSTQLIEDVRAEGREGSRLGATGVPFFVINRKYAISGAQPSDVFLKVLQKAWAEEHEAKVN